MIHVKKFMEHVYEKIVISDNNSNSSNNEKPPIPPDELSNLAEAKVEIHCNDMVSLDLNYLLHVTFFHVTLLHVTLLHVTFRCLVFVFDFDYVFCFSS